MSTVDHPPVEDGDGSAAPESPAGPEPMTGTVESPTGEGSTPEPKPKRRRGMLVTIILLSLALVATGAVLTVALLQLDSALVQIDEQREQLDEQGDLIDQKETFSSAATELMATAAQLDGVPFATLVDSDYHRTLIQRAWTHRWNSIQLRRTTEDVQSETAKLAALVASATEQRESNGSDTYFEKITDQLGQGYVTTSLNTVDELCGKDPWGCVNSDDPLTIHYDQAETRAEPFMNDWLRKGLAYHEYAHVLQFTNPEQTRKAEEAFDGDWETMADCYALTYLKGWTLDHRIWVNSYQYWDVSVGYGYTCNSEQRRAVREWVESLGYTHEPISQ